jgi:hypothetical protein
MGLLSGQTFNNQPNGNIVVDILELSLTRLQGGPVFTVHVLYQHTAGDKSQLVLTFSGGSGASQVVGGSLADGDYRLAFLDGFIGSPADVPFHRLLGDVNGDRQVDDADNSGLRAALGSRRGVSGKGVPAYVSYFDFDGDGDVDTDDLLAFKKRQGTGL